MAANGDIDSVIAQFEAIARDFPSKKIAPKKKRSLASSFSDLTSYVSSPMPSRLKSSSSSSVISKGTTSEKTEQEQNAAKQWLTKLLWNTLHACIQAAAKSSNPQEVMQTMQALVNNYYTALTQISGKSRFEEMQETDFQITFEFLEKHKNDEKYNRIFGLLVCPRTLDAKPLILSNSFLEQKRNNEKQKITAALWKELKDHIETFKGDQDTREQVKKLVKKYYIDLACLSGKLDLEDLDINDLHPVLKFITQYMQEDEFDDIRAMLVYAETFLCREGWLRQNGLLSNRLFFEMFWPSDDLEQNGYGFKTIKEANSENIKNRTALILTTALCNDEVRKIFLQLIVKGEYTWINFITGLKESIHKMLFAESSYLFAKKEKANPFEKLNISSEEAGKITTAVAESLFPSEEAFRAFIARSFPSLDSSNSLPINSNSSHHPSGHAHLTIALEKDEEEEDISSHDRSEKDVDMPSEDFGHSSSPDSDNILAQTETPNSTSTSLLDKGDEAAIDFDLVELDISRFNFEDSDTEERDITSETSAPDRDRDRAGSENTDENSDDMLKKDESSEAGTDSDSEKNPEDTSVTKSDVEVKTPDVQRTNLPTNFLSLLSTPFQSTFNRLLGSSGTDASPASSTSVVLDHYSSDDAKEDDSKQDEISIQPDITAKNDDSVLGISTLSDEKASPPPPTMLTFLEYSLPPKDDPTLESIFLNDSLVNPKLESSHISATPSTPAQSFIRRTLPSKLQQPSLLVPSTVGQEESKKSDPLSEIPSDNSTSVHKHKRSSSMGTSSRTTTAKDTSKRRSSLIDFSPTVDGLLNSPSQEEPPSELKEVILTPKSSPTKPPKSAVSDIVASVRTKLPEAPWSTKKQKNQGPLSPSIPTNASTPLSSRSISSREERDDKGSTDNSFFQFFSTKKKSSALSSAISSTSSSSHNAALSSSASYKDVHTYLRTWVFSQKEVGGKREKSSIQETAENLLKSYNSIDELNSQSIDQIMQEDLPPQYVDSKDGCRVTVKDIEGTVDSPAQMIFTKREENGKETITTFKETKDSTTNVDVSGECDQAIKGTVAAAKKLCAVSRSNVFVFEVDLSKASRDDQNNPDRVNARYCSALLEKNIVPIFSRYEEGKRAQNGQPAIQGNPKTAIWETYKALCKDESRNTAERYLDVIFSSRKNRSLQRELIVAFFDEHYDVRDPTQVASSNGQLYTKQDLLSSHTPAEDVKALIQEKIFNPQQDDTVLLTPPSRSFHNH